jgi:hypothetical protein
VGSDRHPLFVSGLMRLDFYLIDLPGASCLNIAETVAVKMRHDKRRKIHRNFSLNIMLIMRSETRNELTLLL